MYPDLPRVIHDALLADRREPTGMLHCSSHSWWPLRFTQLSQVFPEDETDFGSLITMKIGTLVHKWLEECISKYLEDGWELVNAEIDLTENLPDSWTGTCDYFLRHKPSGTLAVSDLKTSKPEAIPYLNGEPKESHWIQTSCYHGALSETHNLDPDISVCYLPKGKTAKQETVLPVIVSKPAMSQQEVFAMLWRIKADVDAYKAEYARTGEPLNKFLAPMPEPEAKIGWNKAQNVWDVTLRPSWTEEYIGARFGEKLCPRTPSQKVGHWTDDGNVRHYVPRKGVVQPDSIPEPRTR